MVVNGEKVSLKYEESVKKMLNIYQYENRKLKPMISMLIYEVAIILYDFILLKDDFPIYVVGLYLIPLLLCVCLERYKIHIYKQSESCENYYQLSFQIIFWKTLGITFATFICPIAIVQNADIAFGNELLYLDFIYIFFIQLFCAFIGALISYLAEKINVEKNYPKQSALFMGIGTFVFIGVMVLLSLSWFVILMLFALYALGFAAGDALYKSLKIKEEGLI